MNLVVDIGNNYFKLGVFQDSNLLYNLSKNNNFIHQTIPEVLKKYNAIKYALISNVSSININDVLPAHIELFELNHSLKLPFIIEYDTKDSLGNDRIALAAAAAYQFPMKNNLIIDAGTCITIDLLDNKSVFRGGLISPGISMRYKSLHDNTSGLPLLEKHQNFSYPGNSTKKSIHTGVMGGVSHEINGFIMELNSKYKDLNIILTGGDAKFLSKTLKITIFANQIFILEGINSILNLNK
tara:strand:- start:9868 stop:10587 length:720 start_codon:yes stop_codon:yes gene_type:complete